MAYLALGWRRFDTEGPGGVRLSDSPGFLALNYGRRTPISVILAHLAYGAILGLLYRPRGEESGP